MEPARKLLQTAWGLQATGDIDGAAAICEEVLGREPENASALHALGVAMNRREDFPRAADLLERAVARRPSDPVYHVDLGESYRNLGQYRRATAL